MTANGVRYYSSLEQVFDKTYPPGTPPEPFRGYFGEDARLSLMIGIENHWAGAQQAYDKLFAIIGQPASNGGLSSLAQDAGWAIAPPS